MAATPIIDTQAIENLRALNPGDGDEFLREIIGIFLEDTPQRITELSQSLTALDTGKFTRAAHSIKGSSANLGAAALRAVAEKLEHQSRTEGLGAVAPLVGELKAEFAHAETELRKLIAPK
jgi:HPt (histidine-containing phosphotransfer) domain-containing protein